MSVEGKSAVVWLEPKKVLDEATRRSIDAKINIYIAGFDLRLGSISITTGENLPSVLASLGIIRQIAPAEATTLKEAFQRAGFSVPSVDWLNRRLDVMRKSGKIVRLEDGRYTLSLRSLRELGTAKNGRTSPDVSRMLALVRPRL
jgi:hypothetical protein